MSSAPNRRIVGIVTMVAVVLAIIGVWAWRHSHSPAAEPLKATRDAYRHGHYRDAEAQAQRVIDQYGHSKDPKLRRNAVEARYTMAFAAARQKKMAVARDRFALLKHEAAALPDKGKMPPPGQGWQPYTLEEDAAYQHAVCTAALGDKKAAEAEFVRFIHDYPESTLMNGVMQRIERLHGGDTPPEIEAQWRQAQKISQARQEKREREQSLCGPECLAELLRRRGEKPDIKALANEVRTTSRGTSLKDLADVARKHGFDAKGYALTYKGLLKQKMPVIALVQPGHYVILDGIVMGRIAIWDPNGEGPKKPGEKGYDEKEFQKIWGGIALTMQPLHKKR